MKTILLILLSFSIEIKAQLNCSAEGYVSSLFYKKNGVNHELVDFSFEKSSYIPSYEFCAAFIDYVRIRSYFKDNRSQSLKFQKLITEGDNNPIRLLGNDRSELYQLCIESKSCRILFPYYVLEWPLLKNELNSLFEPNLNICENIRFHNLKDEKKIIKPLPNQDFYFWEQPEKNMISQLNENINENTNEIHISSMTISEEEIASLDAKILKFPNLKIYVYFSYPFNSISNGFPKWMDSVSGRIFFYPILTTPDMLSNYHIKGVAIKGRINKLIFSSSNFRNYKQEKLHDLGFTISNTLLVDQFINILSTISKNNCSNHKALNCHLEARFTYHEKAQFTLRNEFARGCNNLPKRRNPEHLLSNETLILRGPMRSMISRYINMAEKSIEIYAHQINDAEILSLLKQKSSQGIKVNVYRGKNKVSKKDSSGAEFIQQYNPKLEMHIKVMIIDGKLAFLTSANLTASSLDNNLENGFLLEDHLNIKSIKDYLIKNKTN